MIKMRMELDNELENAVVAGATVRAVCKSLGFDATAHRDVELCVVEAVTNAVLHAYRPGERGAIGLHAEWSQAAIRIWVTDRGRTIEPEIRKRHLGMTGSQTAQLIEGGRGLFLMSSLMDELRFSSNDGVGNVVFMRKSSTDDRLSRHGSQLDSTALDTAPLWVDDIEDPTAAGEAQKDDEARRALRRR